MSRPPAATPTGGYAERHIRFGWWSLLLFAALGLALESLNGFKVRWYLDVSNETRRLMWTLAHAHGTLLALVHVVYGLTLRTAADPRRADQRMVSSALIAASILLPGGFFLAGIAFFSGDPGVGIVLVPLGAVLLLGAVYRIAAAPR